MIFKLRVSRTQWAVGHGFFHSGIIESGGKPFVYVYDCGAKLANQRVGLLDQEIDEFGTRLRQNQIRNLPYWHLRYRSWCRPWPRDPHVDVMYISHFDYDHVSGIPSLAKQVQIDRFVIPMVPVSQRIFCLTSSLFPSIYHSGSGNSPNDDENVGDIDEWYWDFIANPVTALREITGNVAEVQQVEPAAGMTEEGGPDLNDPEREFILSNLDISSGYTSRASDLYLSTAMNRRSIWNVVNENEIPVWEFKTHILKDAQNQATFFVQELKRMNLIKDEGDLENSGTLKKLVLKHHNSGLKTAYENAVAQIGSSHTLNITSLMLYSGTVLGQRIRCYRSKATPHDRPEIGAWPNVAGWIGYGDVSLRAKKRLNEVIDAFERQRKRTYIIAPPHHGSPRDWSPKLLEGFGPNGNFVPTCVFGADGSYNHPGHGVLLDVNSSGGTAIVVTSDPRSRWTDYLTVYIEA